MIQRVRLMGACLSLMAASACSDNVAGTGAASGTNSSATGAASAASGTTGGPSSASGAAAATSGASSGVATSGVATTGISGNDSGSASGGASGSTASAGATGASGSAASGASAGATDSEAGITPEASTDEGGAKNQGGDTPPWRAIQTDSTGWRQVQFSARQADPTVSDPNSHPDALQRASVDTSKPLKKKLCVVLTGIGTGPGQGVGDWAGHQGFHVFQVGYSNAISPAAPGDTNPDTPGNTRMNQFDGKGRTPSNAQTLRPDSIEERTIKAIQYLTKADPGGDWGWFLNQDGTMRWSDGCFIGYSYGASHLAVIARYVRIGLGVSTSGPQSEGHPAATWIMMPSATPLERLFAIYGSLDGPATPGHYDDTTKALGYIGDVLMTTTTAQPGTPPYMGSHRIEVDGQGHTEFCAGIPPPYCAYMFGL
jgi:hypothetical protein